jgi:hypothetical protein
MDKSKTKILLVIGAIGNPSIASAIIRASENNDNIELVEELPDEVEEGTVVSILGGRCKSLEPAENLYLSDDFCCEPIEDFSWASLDDETGKGARRRRRAERGWHKQTKKLTRTKKGWR